MAAVVPAVVVVMQLAVVGVPAVRGSDPVGGGSGAIGGGSGAVGGGGSDTSPSQGSPGTPPRATIDISAE